MDYWPRPASLLTLIVRWAVVVRLVRRGRRGWGVGDGALHHVSSPTLPSLYVPSSTALHHHSLQHKLVILVYKLHTLYLFARWHFHLFTVLKDSQSSLVTALVKKTPFNKSELVCLSGLCNRKMHSFLSESVFTYWTFYFWLLPPPLPSCRCYRAN